MNPGKGFNFALGLCHIHHHAVHLAGGRRGLSRWSAVGRGFLFGFMQILYTCTASTRMPAIRTCTVQGGDAQ